MTSIDTDRTVRRWNLQSAQPLDEFQLGRADFLWAHSVGPHGRFLAMAINQDSTVGIWDVRTKNVDRELPIQRRRATVLKFSQDGRLLFVGSNGGKLTLHEIDSEREIGQFTGHRSTLKALAISPDEKQIVSSDRQGRVIVWDVKSSEPLFTLSLDTDSPVISLDWSSDNRYIAAGRRDGTVQRWTIPAAP